ncbi:CLUMA_CG007962, isoform A [Clunio marinus]|uniref:CLUMA_CG007962, isoform A n=1 Tax=Clunio marinus TaxID=568069 RepID=A0A1J1I293_9DIPT|nr:CLUMA_CG007962, isoform A [Clunio marinus]
MENASSSTLKMSLQITSNANRFRLRILIALIQFTDNKAQLARNVTKQQQNYPLNQFSFLKLLKSETFLRLKMKFETKRFLNGDKKEIEQRLRSRTPTEYTDS